METREKSFASFPKAVGALSLQYAVGRSLRCKRATCAAAGAFLFPLSRWIDAKTGSLARDIAELNHRGGQRARRPGARAQSDQHIAEFNVVLSRRQDLSLYQFTAAENYPR